MMCKHCLASSLPLHLPSGLDGTLFVDALHDRLGRCIKGSFLLSSDTRYDRRKNVPSFRTDLHPANSSAGHLLPPYGDPAATAPSRIVHGALTIASMLLANLTTNLHSDIPFHPSCCVFLPRVLHSCLSTCHSRLYRGYVDLSSHGTYMDIRYFTEELYCPKRSI